MGACKLALAIRTGTSKARQESVESVDNKRKRVGNKISVIKCNLLTLIINAMKQIKQMSACKLALAIQTGTSKARAKSVKSVDKRENKLRN